MTPYSRSVTQPKRRSLWLWLAGGIAATLVGLHVFVASQPPSPPHHFTDRQYINLTARMVCEDQAIDAKVKAETNFEPAPPPANCD